MSTNASIDDWAPKAMYIGASLGALGSGIIIVSFLSFAELRKRAYRLVFWIALSEFSSNVSLLVLHRDSDWLPNSCEIMGTMQQFFTLSAVLWSVVLALTLYAAVVLHGRSSSFASFLDNTMAVHAVTWGVAAVTTLVPLFAHAYGPAGILEDVKTDGKKVLREWCWITNDSAMSLTLRYACFYGPLWVSFLVASCAHFFVWRSLQHFEALAQSAQDLRTTVATAGASDNACSSKNFRNLRSSVLASQQPPPTTNTTAPLPGEPSAVVQRVRASLRHYPVIFLVAWVPASTFRIAQDLGFFGLNGRDEGDALALSLFTALYAPAVQAIANAWVYVRTPGVQRQWRGLWERWCTCNSCREDEDDVDKNAKAMGNESAYSALPGDSHETDQSRHRRRRSCLDNYCCAARWCRCTPQNNEEEVAGSAHAHATASLRAQQWFNSGNGSFVSSRRINSGFVANDVDARNRLTISVHPQKPSWLGNDERTMDAEAGQNASSWRPSSSGLVLNYSGGGGGNLVIPREDPDRRNDSSGAWSSFTSNPGSQGNLSVDSEVSTSAI